MDSPASPTSLPEPRAASAAHVDPALPAPAQLKSPQKISPAAQAAADQRVRQEAEQSAALMPDRLVVEKDERAGRFVQTFMDFETKEVRWRYPSEAQLAYSRAIAAYVRALSES